MSTVEGHVQKLGRFLTIFIGRNKYFVGLNNVATLSPELIAASNT
jgi:hypothetical protein